MKAKVTEEGILIPKSLLEGVDEVEIYKTGDRVVVKPVVSPKAASGGKTRKNDGKSFVEKWRGTVRLHEDDPDPRYQYLIQKYLSIPE